jgi:hypothetical protein
MTSGRSRNFIVLRGPAARTADRRSITYLQSVLIVLYFPRLKSLVQYLRQRPPFRVTDGPFVDKIGDRQHHKHDGNNAGTHGVGTGRPAIVIQHNDLDRCQVNRCGYQKDHRADSGHGAHEEVDEVLEKRHPRQRKDDIKKGTDRIPSQADRGLLD